MILSRLKTLPTKGVNLLLAHMARSIKGRRMMGRWIQDAQGHLGIGSGVEVDTSGEQVIFERLRDTARTLPRPLCVFDVGANQGQFLTLMEQHLTGVPHQTYCFEPSPSTFEMLRNNVANLSHVTLNPVGLGDAAGERELFSDTPGSGMASLTQRRLDHFGIDFQRREHVQIQTLDGYCAAHNVTQIDLLKLDVEGHELDVLKGGTRMLAEQRIGMVTFEFGGTNIDTRTFFQDFYYFFQAHGLSSIFRILPSGSLEKIEAYREELEQFRTTNFLVLRDAASSTPAPA